MGLVHLTLKEFARLDFNPFPTKPVKGLRVVRIPNCHTLVAVDEDGKLYTSHYMASRSYSYCVGNWAWIGPLLEGVVRLGIMPASAKAEHMENVRARAAQEHAQHVLDYDVKELEKDFGVKLTAAQRKKIEAAAK